MHNNTAGANVWTRRYAKVIWGKITFLGIAAGSWCTLQILTSALRPSAAKSQAASDLPSYGLRRRVWPFDSSDLERQL